jgi:N-acetylmuramoyl-L-alanine amidase
MKLIACSDGHGMETQGKRTPNFDDGTFMKENEFNREVIRRLDINLKRCGFATLHVSPGDSDVPLKTRTDAANNAKADLYISVHANAYKSVWGDWGGLSTHIYAKGGEAEKLAKIVHKHLLKGTKLRDRGIVVSNFHELRETDMPAILLECAFMDNLAEAKLLLSDKYRQECADEGAMGVCEYYGMPYVKAKIIDYKKLYTDLKTKLSNLLKGEK